MIRYGKIVALSLLPVTFLLSIVNLPSLAETAIERATLLYQQGKYQEAMDGAEAYLKLNPNSAAAHYLLGNIFYCNKSMVEASREYQKAARLNPTGPSGIYSKQALARMNPNQNQSQNQNQNQARTQPAAPSPAAPKGEAPDRDVQALKNAVSATSRQTSEESKAMEAECDNKLAEINRVLEDKIKVLQEEMKTKIADNGVYVKLGYHSYYDPEPLNVPIREEYRDKIQKLRDDADKRCELVKASYKQRMEIVEQAAINVDKGLVNSDANAAIKLRANGSDLHVHNYESSDQPSGQTVPMIAEPAKLSTAAKSGAANKTAAGSNAKKTDK